MSTRSARGDRIDGEVELTEQHANERPPATHPSRWQFSRYDLILVLLPLPLLLGAGWATVTMASMSAGVGLGSVPTLALLAYSLFIGGPTTPGDVGE